MKESTGGNSNNHKLINEELKKIWRGIKIKEIISSFVIVFGGYMSGLFLVNGSFIGFLMVFLSSNYTSSFFRKWNNQDIKFYQEKYINEYINNCDDMSNFDKESMELQNYKVILKSVNISKVLALLGSVCVAFGLTFIDIFPDSILGIVNAFIFSGYFVPLLNYQNSILIKKDICVAIRAIKERYNEDFDDEMKELLSKGEKVEKEFKCSDKMIDDRNVEIKRLEEYSEEFDDFEEKEEDLEETKKGFSRKRKK